MRTRTGYMAGAAPPDRASSEGYRSQGSALADLKWTQRVLFAGGILLIGVLRIRPGGSLAVPEARRQDFDRLLRGRRAAGLVHSATGIRYLAEGGACRGG